MQSSNHIFADGPPAVNNVEWNMASYNLLVSTCLVGASRRQMATTPPCPTAANLSPLGANRTAAALPQFASLQQNSNVYSVQSEPRFC